MTRFYFLTLFLASLFLFSCKENDDDAFDDGFLEGYLNENPMASDEMVTHLTAVIGDIPSDIGSGINQRFMNQTAQLFPSSAKALIFHANSMNAIDKEAFLELYYNDGIIIVLDPDHNQLTEWLEEMGIRDSDINPHIVPSTDEEQTPHELYAFNRSNNHYLLDFVPSDLDHNDFLNPLVSWVNKYADKPADPPLLFAASEQDVAKIFSYQTIEKTFNLYLYQEEAHVKWSKPDIIEKWGQISVAMTVYPLYAFQDQAAKGDYYIVNMRVTAHNNQMYAGNWTQKHGGVYVRLCGFYMTYLSTRSEITTAGAGSSFPPYGTPMPATTVGATSYTSGLSWNLGGSVTGQVGTVSGFGASITGGVTFNNSQTRSISDVNIENAWTGGATIYRYRFNNLPHYDKGKIKITDPPAISVNNAEFFQDWVWHMPNTTDNGTQKFEVKNTIWCNYESCHFITTGADFTRHNRDDAFEGGAKNISFTFTLTAPPRKPTGTLTITNGTVAAPSNVPYITNIQIWKQKGSETKPSGAADYEVKAPDKMDDNGQYSFAPNQKMIKYLPVGDYFIQIQMGTNVATLTDYYLEKPITITRGSSFNLNAPFDFKAGAY